MRVSKRRGACASGGGRAAAVALLVWGTAPGWLLTAQTRERSCLWAGIVGSCAQRLSQGGPNTGAHKPGPWSCSTACKSLCEPPSTLQASSERGLTRWQSHFPPHSTPGSPAPLISLCKHRDCSNDAAAPGARSETLDGCSAAQEPAAAASWPGGHPVQHALAAAAG